MGISERLKAFFTTKNNVTIVAALCWTLVVVAWILLLTSAKRLNFAKAYGIRKRETCGNEYLESETARYELNNAYNSSVDNLIHVSNIILYTVNLVPILVSVAIVIVSIIMLKKSSTSDKTIKTGILVLTACAVAAILGVYLMFWIKELRPNMQSKYLTMYNLEKPSVSHKVNIIALSISIIIVFWISMIAYKHIGAEEDTANKMIWPKDTETYQRIAIVFTMVVITCASILFVIHSNRPLLQQNIVGKYGTIKSDLQTTALSLSTNPDFKRYLEINIKRAHPSMDGIPNITDVALKDNLFAYLEHRPGIDRFDVGQEYVTVGTLKKTFDVSIAKATDERNAILKLLQTMYAIEVDTLYTFEESNIETWIKHPYMFGDSMFAASLIGHLKASRPFTYENLQKTIPSFNFHIDKNAVDNKKKLDYLLHWFVHFSTYKDDVAISYETIDYYLSTDQTLSTDTIAQLKADVAKLESASDSSAGITTLGNQMRAARASEGEIVNATDKFVNHVYVITIGIIGIMVYLALHYVYLKNKAMLVSILTIIILLGIFVITWYAWFFAKLNL